MTEKLIELIPDTKTVWTIESDTMGMKRMMHDARFVFQLEKTGDYQPAHWLAAILNRLVMQRMIRSAQSQILENIKSVAEITEPQG